MENSSFEPLEPREGPLINHKNELGSKNIPFEPSEPKEEPLINHKNELGLKNISFEPFEPRELPQIENEQEFVLNRSIHAEHDFNQEKCLEMIQKFMIEKLLMQLYQDCKCVKGK